MSAAHRRLAWRFCLVPLFVLAVYGFSWDYLRFATSEAVLRAAPVFGVVLRRVSASALFGNGTQFEFAISCTLIDALAGSIPLLWRLDRGIPSNLLRLSVYFPVLMALNVVRLEVSHRLYALGLPWLAAHECISGLSYFLLFVWIMRQRAWERRRKAHVIIVKSRARPAHQNPACHSPGFPFGSQNARPGPSNQRFTRCDSSIGR